MTKPFAIIAEDDPKLGMIYEAALQQAGYETYLDKNGDQIMDKLPSVDPALIILDVHLPYASGVDILRQIHADGRWAQVPIIVATADLFVAKSLQGQAEYVLVKPVSVAHLLEIVDSLRDKIVEKSSGDLDEKEKLP